MAMIVIGGHARNVGKTFLAAAIVAAWPQYGWTAVKLSSHWHDEGAADENNRDICRIDEEQRSGQTDTGRYLAAGAKRSIWVRVQPGKLRESLPRLTPLFNGCNVIVESNGIAEYVTPDLFLMVFRCGVADFKESARRTLPRVHAIVAVECEDVAAARENLPIDSVPDIPIFPAPLPQTLTSELARFIETRLTLY